MQRTLAFHNIEPGFSWGITTLSPKQLRAVLTALSQFPTTNGGSVRESVRLTFDDGYQSFFDYADPLLREFGVSATIFSPTHYLGQINKWDYSWRVRPERHLNADELRALVEKGYDIQAHGHTHGDLATMNSKRVRDELYLSKRILEDVTGREVREICYPFGRFNRTVEQIAIELGYTRGWSLRPQDAGPFTYGRWGVYAFDTPLTIAHKLQFGVFSKVEAFKLGVVNRLSRGTALAFWTEKISSSTTKDASKSRS